MYLLSFILIEIAIIAVHFWVCKKLLWLKYDRSISVGIPRATLTYDDLIEQQYQLGGPLLLIPGVNLILLLETVWMYLSMRYEWNGYTKWKNKELKR